MMIYYTAATRPAAGQITDVATAADGPRADLVGIEAPPFAQLLCESFVAGAGFGGRTIGERGLVDILEPSVLVLRQHPVGHLEEDAVLLGDVCLEQGGIRERVLDRSSPGSRIPCRDGVEAVRNRLNIGAADFVLSQHHPDGSAVARHPGRLERREEVRLFLGVVPGIGVVADEIHPLPEGVHFEAILASGGGARRAQARDHREDGLVFRT